MNLSRRAFLGLLGGTTAAVVFDPHRVIFDMGRSLFIPRQEIIPATVTLNTIIQKYITPVLSDQIFTPSPLFQYLRAREVVTNGVIHTPISEGLEIVWEVTPNYMEPIDL